MARKKSIKKSAQEFLDRANDLTEFTANTSCQTTEHTSLLYDYAVIRLYREFESLMLDVLVGAINNDTTTLSNQKGIKFPKHLSDEVCEYLVTGGGYFDFKGRDGLIKFLKKFVPDTHFLATTIQDKKYKDALEQLSALRNYAAHNSTQSRKAALVATKQQRIGSAGAWLKRFDRFTSLVDNLKSIASEIKSKAQR